MKKENKMKLLSSGLILSSLASTAFADINEITSRSVRTDYFCNMAAQPNFKPNFNEMDAFRIDKGNLSVADLYGDGIDDVLFIQHGPDFEPWKPPCNCYHLF